MRHGPYKGTARSYQIEDEQFFFGRSIEAERLIARILSSDMTLLCARSGAGKTSLLNSKIIPNLERHGWTVVASRPDDNPTEAVITRMLLGVLPPVSVEIAELELARKRLDVAAGASLRSLLDRYDELADRDDRKRELIRAVELPEPVAALPRSEDESVRSMLSLVLRGAIEVDDYLEHLAIVAGNDPVGTDPRSPSADAGIDDVLGFLRRIEPAYESKLGSLVPQGEHGRLCEAIDRVFGMYGTDRAGFRLVIVLDQFEEIFTNYRDRPRRARTRDHDEGWDWRLRRAFFRNFEEAYRRIRGGDAGGGDLALEPLPVRFVIAMREEYLSQMDVMRRFVPDLDENAYRLNLLTRDQAKIAIQRPAKKFGFGYTRKCLNLILDELSSEEGFVSPGILQMVCSLLWAEKGRDLASRDREGGLRRVRTKVFKEAVGGVDGVVDTFLANALNDLRPRQKGRPDAASESNDYAEALEVLQALITTERTRNLRSEYQLINAPFRFPAQRRRIVDHLEGAGILRTESRLGRKFIEIAHELLIDPIFRIYRSATAGDSGHYRLYRGALAALERIAEQKNAEEAAKRLSEEEFRAAHDFDKRINFDWENPRTERSTGVEIMFRAALRYSSDEAILKYWADALPDTAGGGAWSMADVPAWSTEQQVLGLREWRSVCRNPDAQPLDDDQLETVFRSAIELARYEESGEVEYWARRFAAL